MKRVPYLLALLLILSSYHVFAQSGRKRTVEAAPTPSPATKTPTADSNEGISESRTSAEGETVEGDVVRVDTSLVTVPVSVIDRNGKYVPSLQRGDFRIFEDGVEQKIAYFATVDQPFTVVLVIDTSGSTEYRLEDIHAAAITFVNQLKDNDRVMVMSFDDTINVLTKPTTDRNAIISGIRRSTTGGGTRLYDTVDNVLKKQLRRIAGRKAVVFFTDGVDTSSYSATFDSTLREAEEADAPIYSVAYNTSRGGIGHGWPIPSGRGPVIFGIPLPRPGVPGGVPGSTDPNDYKRANVYLRALSDRTGGRYYNADLVGIAEAFRQVAEELGRQYSLGYYPKAIAKAGQRRQIKVQVNQPNLAVKARDSYIYTDKKVPADQSKQTQPFLGR